MLAVSCLGWENGKKEGPIETDSKSKAKVTVGPARPSYNPQLYIQRLLDASKRVFSHQ